MGMWRRKEEQSKTISVRVPASVKAELEELRQQAEAAGFDVTATLTEALGGGRNSCVTNLIRWRGRPRRKRRTNG